MKRKAACSIIDLCHSDDDDFEGFDFRKKRKIEVVKTSVEELPKERTVELWIDKAEPRKHMVPIFDSLGTTYTLVEKTLDTGDFWIVSKNEEGMVKVWCVIERKTWDDGYLSITGKRIKQFAVMNKIKNAIPVILLMEGSKCKKKQYCTGDSEKTMKAFLLSKYISGHSVKETATLHDSIMFIHSLANHIGSLILKPPYNVQDSQLGSYLKCISRERLKELSTLEINPLYIPFSAIRGWSITKIKALLVVFPQGIAQICTLTTEDVTRKTSSIKNPKTGRKLIQKNDLTNLFKAIGSV